MRHAWTEKGAYVLLPRRISVRHAWAEKDLRNGSPSQAETDASTRIAESSCSSLQLRTSACKPLAVHVRAVDAVKDVNMIDSGADVSCLPRIYDTCGRAVKSRPMSVQDSTMQVTDRQVEVTFRKKCDAASSCVKRCVIADVTPG